MTSPTPCNKKTAESAWQTLRINVVFVFSCSSHFHKEPRTEGINLKGYFFRACVLDQTQYELFSIDSMWNWNTVKKLLIFTLVKVKIFTCVTRENYREMKSKINRCKTRTKFLKIFLEILPIFCPQKLHLNLRYLNTKH